MTQPTQAQIIDRLQTALRMISIFRQSTYLGDPCEHMEEMARQALEDTAAAQVGEQDTPQSILADAPPKRRFLAEVQNATIERCAQVVDQLSLEDENEDGTGFTLREVAAAIRKLKGRGMTQPTPAHIKAALQRARTILANMALENEGAIFNRWPISHEPLRADAKAALPDIEAAITAAAQVGERPPHFWSGAEEVRLATIERCAQVAEQMTETTEFWRDEIAAAILKLKDAT